MSYNAELQANNADLQAILDAINNLPEGGAATMCTVTVVNNSDDSIRIYPKYEGYSDNILVDRFESTSITVPKQSAVWFEGYVPLGVSVSPTSAGDAMVGSCTYEGMFSIYANGTVTIKNE